MEWRHVLKTEDIESNYTLFSRLKGRLQGKVIASILGKISNFIGYPLAVVLPVDVAEYGGDTDSLRALRILNNLRDNNLVEGFYFNKHQYGDEPIGHVCIVDIPGSKFMGHSGKGADLFDKRETLWPALGEAVERYSLSFYKPKPGETIDSKEKDLKAKKVDLSTVAGFEEDLKKKGHPDFELKYDEDTVFSWLKTTELTKNEEAYAPLQWFGFNYVEKQKRCEHNKDSDLEPILNAPMSTGAAAGQNMTDATLRGLLEVIERDSFIIYWLNELAAKRINISSFEEERFNKIQRIIDRYGFEVHVLYLETDMPVHTVVALVIDRGGVGPALVLGSKTGVNLSDVTYGALNDVLAQRGLSRHLSAYFKNTEVEYSNIDKIGHEGRMYYWCHLDKLKFLEPYLQGPLVSAKDLPTYSYSKDKEKQLDQLLDFFREKQYKVYVKDILCDEFQPFVEGLSVVMVKVPEMQAVYLDESLKSTAGKRLRYMPEYLGLKKKGTRDHFSNVPHPYP